MLNLFNDKEKTCEKAISNLPAISELVHCSGSTIPYDTFEILQQGAAFSCSWLPSCGCHHGGLSGYV